MADGRNITVSTALGDKLLFAQMEGFDEISQCFLDKVGLNWCKGKSAPRTYELMKAAIGDNSGAIRFGGMTIHTA